YHITSRGNAGNRIFRNDKDREHFLAILSFVIERFHWLCHAYCLMDNHYHLIIETPDGNLSRGMRQLNGIYTQKYNWKYKKTGHVFQGRYKAIIVDKDSYLLELCRYVVLNPVRANLTEKPGDWRWSSYLSTISGKGIPQYLTIDWILGQFSNDKKRAQKLYRNFVIKGIKKETPWKNLKGQIFLGEKRFIEKCKTVLTEKNELKEVPRNQRHMDRPRLEELFKSGKKKSKVLRNKIMYDAHVKCGYTLKEIADYLKIHYTTVSKAVKNVDNKN
ncbi:MAG: transposase, partial [Proteobacteria bacterium]|nr:transposase [Pseudomonadota bacterium]